MRNDRFRADRALRPLKPFQRRTVEYVFNRLYGSEDPIRQFLVADEVGLGKTMVARGLIARTIEHLWDTTRRIDVLYICSNQAIAAQNINRLNVLGHRSFALPTRMTLVPLQLQGREGLNANKVNFISLTPGTTFDLRSATGVAQERAFLRHLLTELVSRPRGLHNLLQVSSGAAGWNRTVDDFDMKAVDHGIIDRFRNNVRTDETLFEELERVCDLFPRRRESYPPEMAAARNALIARLRAKLSHACVDALEPDLIIMDEFQRFRSLLHDDSDAAILARELFDYSDDQGHAARTLLLSATPYRMLTLSGDDPEEGDHYQDFLETLSFLYGHETGKDVAATLAREMRAFRDFLHGLPASRPDAVAARITIEEQLRKVIARTERVGSTQDRDSMVAEPPVPVSLATADLIQAAAVASVAGALDAPEIIEYWKSAPYLLNFMREYKLKRLLENQAEALSPALHDALLAARPAMLNRQDIDAYAHVEPANGRMRAVMDEVFSEGLEQHLWIAPALPYYGEARSNPPLTKALIFSAWAMVPDAISALLSYEAERRMGAGNDDGRYFAQHRTRPLQFRRDQGRLTGLRALLLLYPSPTLAKLGDPLAVLSSQDEALSLDAMRHAAADRLAPALTALRQSSVGNAEEADIAEWAAPAVIDSLLGSAASDWLQSPTGMSALPGEEGFHDHVAELARVATDRHFASVGEDLRDLLVDVALGSPAVCALRALRRIAPELAWDDEHLLAAAAEVAWAFRTLFNQHDAVALLRRGAEGRYWRHVLTYSVQNNLQAVLDEYAHYLQDAEGLVDAAAEERVESIGRAMASALSIRPSQIDVDDPQITEAGLTIGKFQMRGRFAMRLADYRDEEGAVARLGGVRDAFNSPFRPFVLATTSIGQEGLDFHPYCYRVYHWNLPDNPVDLEQREGRVHRYKGHAIRLNIAERQSAILRARQTAPDDPWALMFEDARVETSTDSGLIPYWIYEGAVRVERRVPMLPFSRETTRLKWLKRSLTVYRLAFGQPRQDDLLNYLQSVIGDAMSEAELAELQISLEPDIAISGQRAVHEKPSERI
ncbi:MAG TPA: helicase-related protein [Gammaproteobacteria bacterium]|nr:helicase-related protein [Gammaproteobacteria bacterium]